MEKSTQTILKGIPMKDFLEAQEKELIELALKESKNKPAWAARILGMNRTTLLWKIKKYWGNEYVERQANRLQS